MLVVQSCPTCCDPMDCSLPGSSGILWNSSLGFSRQEYWSRDAISSSKEFSQPRNWNRVSCIVLIKHKFFMNLHNYSGMKGHSPILQREALCSDSGLCKSENLWPLPKYKIWGVAVRAVWYGDLDPRLANFSWRGPDNKYFWLCWPHRVSITTT